MPSGGCGASSPICGHGRHCSDGHRIGSGPLLEAERRIWPDNETAPDFLNFFGVADTVAEIIVQARGRPISIGVSSAWGIGKSSMIKLIQASLAECQRQPS